MLAQTYINNLLLAKLDSLINSSTLLSESNAGVEVNKTDDTIIIYHQPNHSKHANKVFICEKHDNAWVIVYSLVIDKPIWLDKYHIDAWFDHVTDGFVVKVCSDSDTTIGITYHYELTDNGFKLIKTTENKRLMYLNEAYYLDTGEI